jgi:hypothetical protein
MKKDNQPIVLSGRVYVDKLLAAEHPRLALPDRVQRGDLKVIALMHSEAPAGKPKGTPRQFKRPKPLEPYSGYFCAYIFDGAQWRKFAIRAVAGVPATYASEGERRSRILGVVEALKGLRNTTAIWGLRAFEVHNPATFGKAVPTIHPVKPHTTGDTTARTGDSAGAAPVQAKVAPTGGQGDGKAASPHAEPDFKLEPYAADSKKGKKRSATNGKGKPATGTRKRRTKKADPNQATLFTE